MRVEGALEAARRAFKNPMLALLNRGDVALVVALLRVVFPANRPEVTVADAHTEIDDALSSLRAQGHDDVPDRAARDLCRQWVSAGWLVRQVNEADVETYRLSAYAVDALEVADRAGGARSRVTRSRVLTLLEAIDRLGQDADPDGASRMRWHTDQINRHRAELKRLDAGGELDQVDDEQLVEETENVLSLVRELPADFARVAESIRAIQRETVTALRQDDRPTGEVLAEYLNAADNLMEATIEGRAFAGAQRLLDDPARLDDIASTLDMVLRHRFADRLTDRQRTEIRAITDRIERGFTDVLTAQRQASRVISTQVRHHDPTRDRQIDDVLRNVLAAFSTWIPASRRGEVVEPAHRLPRAATDKLRFAFTDLGPVVGPEAITVHDDGGDDAEFGDAHAWGGPRYADINAALGSIGAAESVTVAELFAALGDDARRPVDLVGLLELAARVGLHDDGEVAIVDTVRPDGTHRRFAFEAATILQPEETP
jgi:hypothetical protein